MGRPKKDDGKKRGQFGLGYLYKRGAKGEYLSATSKAEGLYWLEYYTESGKKVRERLEVDGIPVNDLKTAKTEQMRRRASFLTKNRIEELKNIESELKELEGLHAIEDDLANPPMPLSRAWDEYVGEPTRKECGAGNLKSYKGHWDRFYRWALLNKPETRAMRDVDDEVVADYAKDLQGAGYTGSTYNKHIGFLRMMFDVLSKRAKLNGNPWRETKRKRMNQVSKRALTVSELRNVIALASGEMRTLFIVGATTGLRLGDCATLRWCEVDFDAGVIRRKPNKTRYSSGAEVVLGIPMMLFNALQEIPAGDRAEYVVPETARMYLDGKADVLSRRIQAHFISCGIKTRQDGTGTKCHYENGRKVYDGERRAVVEVGFHSLRHTWVSLHAEAGTPAMLIQNTAGHSSPAMTEHYVHISDKTARSIAGSIDAVIAGVGNELEDLRVEARRIIEKADADTLRRMLDVARCR